MEQNRFNQLKEVFSEEITEKTLKKIKKDELVEFIQELQKETPAEILEKDQEILEMNYEIEDLKRDRDYLFHEYGENSQMIKKLQAGALIELVIIMILSIFLL